MQPMQYLTDPVTQEELALTLTDTDLAKIQELMVVRGVHLQYPHSPVHTSSVVAARRLANRPDLLRKVMVAMGQMAVEYRHSASRILAIGHFAWYTALWVAEHIPGMKGMPVSYWEKDDDHRLRLGERQSFLPGLPGIVFYDVVMTQTALRSAWEALSLGQTTAVICFCNRSFQDSVSIVPIHAVVKGSDWGLIHTRIENCPQCKQAPPRRLVVGRKKDPGEEGLAIEMTPIQGYQSDLSCIRMGPCKFGTPNSHCRFSGPRPNCDYFNDEGLQRFPKEWFEALGSYRRNQTPEPRE